jgi:hypothetical protein
MSKRLYLVVLINFLSATATAVGLRVFYGEATISALGKDSPIVLLGLLGAMAIGVVTGILSSYLLRQKDPISTMDDVTRSVMRALRSNQDRSDGPRQIARAA